MTETRYDVLEDMIAKALADNATASRVNVLLRDTYTRHAELFLDGVIPLTAERTSTVDRTSAAMHESRALATWCTKVAAGKVKPSTLASECPPIPNLVAINVKTDEVSGRSRSGTGSRTAATPHEMSTWLRAYLTAHPGSGWTTCLRAARAAGELSSNYPVFRDAHADMLAELGQTAKRARKEPTPAETPAKRSSEPATDDEILTAIRQALAIDPMMKPTEIGRQVRGAGLKAPQARVLSLIADAKRAMEAERKDAKKATRRRSTPKTRAAKAADEAAKTVEPAPEPEPDPIVDAHADAHAVVDAVEANPEEAA